MKLEETEFTKELSELCTKHGKYFGFNKEGLYIIEADCKIVFLEAKPQTATDGSDTKLLTITQKK